MARTFVLSLLVSAFLAAPAQAGTFINSFTNKDWPPTTDFQLKSDPCAQGQCSFTALITFRYGGKKLGSIPLHSPARNGGHWDTKRYGHPETTDLAQFFWSCDSPGKYKWSAKISSVNNGGQRTDYPTESGSWNQPGCSPGKPELVSKRKAKATARKKVIFGDRVSEGTSCKKKEKIGRWTCTVKWSNEARNCTDHQSLFFYSRKVFFRRFHKVSSFRESRSCSS